MEHVYVLTVRLVIAVPEGADPESYTTDAANEMLRGLQRSFAESPEVETALLDYAIGEVVASHVAVEGYEEGDFYLR